MHCGKMPGSAFLHEGHTQYSPWNSHFYYLLWSLLYFKYKWKHYIDGDRCEGRHGQMSPPISPDMQDHHLLSHPQSLLRILLCTHIIHNHSSMSSSLMTFVSFDNIAEVGSSNLCPISAAVLIASNSPMKCLTRKSPSLTPLSSWLTTKLSLIYIVSRNVMISVSV